ncbi:ccr4 associated factor [Coemansia sp. RSA 2610]|nr:ccr4 associated factor [Coemansia sp. RSA 2610]
MLRGLGAVSISRSLSAVPFQRHLSTITVQRPTDFERVFDDHDQYAALEGRALLEVGGADATDFLQGMQCNDMAQIAGRGMLTGFLTPQGRMVADAFVYATGGGYMVEVDARVGAHVQRLLAFYRLRARVTVRDVSAEHQVWSVWGPGSAGLARDASSLAHAWTYDRRAPNMGLRLVVPRTRELAPAGFARHDPVYRLRRILKGVGEGADDFARDAAVPLECNLDIMQGVHFGKGCYVGQELTIRTHHRGVVRKRLVPVLYSRAGDGTATPLRVDCAWTPELRPHADVGRVGVAARRAPGRLASVASAGLALMRLELVAQYEAQQHADTADKIAFSATDAAGNRVFVSPWTPSWWPNCK